MHEAACRKLVSRARAHIGQARVRHETPRPRQGQLLAAFRAALASGRTDELATLLSDNVELSADGGGKVPAIPRPIHGKAGVLEIIATALRRWWSTYEWHATDINGSCGVLLFDAERLVAAVSFAYDEADRAAGIYVMRNPDKLAHLSAAPTSPWAVRPIRSRSFP
jgi:RNA polymerase sigma-70 factor (ECF subfamily)